ncbi:MAG: DUF885 domain-containing protein [Gemmatimonadaceae bacterium]|nr:DUF885 domain-containing protein [Gemmatimonadaceae bacterium]MDQ3243371.1 DUF885 domain-containing protein [Gemmatimonadota bacterium]
MNRRSFVHRATATAAGFGILRTVEACAPPQSASPPPPLVPFPGTFTELRDRYFLYSLERNPVTSTYLGGDGYSPTLAAANSRLRDYRPESIAAELVFYRTMKASIGLTAPATLTPRDRADHELMNAQLDFLIRQIGVHRYHQRSLDTYVSEPFRGVDWQIQQMSELPGGLLGSEADWQQVVARTLATPAYLDVAKANLLAGKKAGLIPDRRMVQRDGIAGSASNAEYFRATLPRAAQRFIGARPFGPPMQAQILGAGIAAATAWEQFAAFLAATFDVNEAVDRYAAGELEYEWRVRNVLRDPRTALQLFEYGAEQVALYTGKMVEVAREFSREAKLNLRFGTPAENYAAVRRVMEFLSKDAPKDDDQLFKWYRDAGTRAVAYGREHKLFDIPATYRLDVVPTPPVLRSTIDAAYYPAPPLKKSGVGRFYLTPTGNDAAALRLNNFSSVADTAVHEGFPGHDWHFKYMTEHGAEISNIRWLTPGAVEDSASMWSDSMAIEGWALYTEELMSEPVPNHKYGFYSAGEYLYELQGQLLRAVRIRVDVGIHTGRMSFDQAVDYFTEHVSFLPGARLRVASDAEARAVTDGATRAIYRYSKWPTQAITYNLGKVAISELRDACRARTGAAFSPREFHERFMREGSIPAAYIRDQFLAACGTAAPP